MAQNCRARIGVRVTHVNDQASGQAGEEAFVNLRQLQRRSVGGHDNLSTTLLQQVEHA
jgi:hypothetical protein